MSRVLVDHVIVRERTRDSGARELQVWLQWGGDIRCASRVVITQANGKPAPFADQIIAVDRMPPWRPSIADPDLQGDI